MWYQFVTFIPSLLGAIVVFVIGVVLAYIVAAVVRRVIQLTGIDEWVDRANINRRLSLEGSRYALVSHMLASIVRWVIIIAALGVSADALQLPGVREFIGTILAYIPNVIVAIVILTIGIIASQIVSELIGVGETAMGLSPRVRRTLVQVAKYSIIVFSIMAALFQLNIVPQLIEIAFAGLVLALALSFGLGGREHADKWIADLKSRA